jgi:hypothetical protein
VTEPIYNPDRMVFEDLDLNDPDVIEAYFDHDVTRALAEDHGRAFRTLPAAQQQAVIERELGTNNARRAELTQEINSRDSDDPVRTRLQDLLHALDRYSDAARLRLLELEDEERKRSQDH